MGRPMRAAVSVITLVAFVLAGCSRAVRIPEAEFAPASERNGLYRIHTANDSYTTWQFSVTDSTVIIEKLSGSDDHYGTLALPFSLRLQDVRSVDRLETDPWKTGLVVGIVFVSAFVIFMNAVVSSFPATD